MREPTLRVYLALVAMAAVTSICVPRATAQEFELGSDDQWVAGEEPEPTSPEGRLAFVRRALASRDYERAEFLATGWIEAFPSHPGQSEARIIRGDALVGQREYYEALFDFEFVARGASGSEWFVTALERELDIAKLFISGTRRKFLGIRMLSAKTEAEELLIRVQERLPGSRLAEEAAMTLANYYFTTRQMSLAVEMYSIFIDNFPRSEYVAQARKRLIYAHLASFKGPEFDANGLFEAHARLRELQAISPSTAQKMGSSALLLRIDDSIAEKRLVTAGWYMRTGDYIAAELTIRRLLTTYPRSVATMRAVELGAKIVDRLPPSVRRDAPDYAELVVLLRTGGDPTEGYDAKPPTSEPADDSSDPAPTTPAPSGDGP